MPRSAVQVLATLGPVGHAPVAPATVASALVVAAGWFLPVPAPWLTAALLAAGTVLAVVVCGEAEKSLGHDAHPIVLDEVIGQSIALLGAPHAWPAFAAAFVLFRVFDIWKPLGIRHAQNLVGGLGVVVDDVLAGLLSCAALHALLAWARSAGWVI